MTDGTGGAAVAAWAIVGLTTLGVILRPFRWPEYIWALLGATLLVALGLLPAGDALAGVARGGDVYLFLVGMMLLAELARQEGVFDWLAAHAAAHARGSAQRLFGLIYLVGTGVTVLLSNDATAVVLTPAVAAVMRAVQAREPLPYLLICAFVANAASFVLPISNPANLVIYGEHLPPLLDWLPRYALPSLLAVVVTYGVLWLTQARALNQPVAEAVPVPRLGAGGRTAALGLLFAAAMLLLASAMDLHLGPPSFGAALATAAAVLLRARRSPMALLRGVSWGMLPLVAGLFVLVEALQRTGATPRLAALLEQAVQQSPTGAAWASGLLVGFGCNLLNNLPAGLLAGRVVELAQVPEQVRSAILIGVDLGPNLSVTGSLATLLWLAALRREGLHVGAWSFLRLGALVMPPALLAALAAAIAAG